jgi:hypothetical protein
MPVIAYDFQRPFAVDFLLQSPQGFFHWLAFFQFNFCQSNSHPLRNLGPRRLRQPGLFSQAREPILPPHPVNPQNTPTSPKTAHFLPTYSPFPHHFSSIISPIIRRLPTPCPPVANILPIIPKSPFFCSAHPRINSKTTRIANCKPSPSPAVR